MDHFFMVWNEGGRAPTVKHETPESAKQEATRLALANPPRKAKRLKNWRPHGPASPRFMRHYYGADGYVPKKRMK